MRQNGNERPDGIEGIAYKELRLLEEVGVTPEVSQRHLSHQLGVALGVTNLLLRNLVKKGYIRSTQVAWKRWVYVLTPAGITRKVHLTLAYVERFLDHYRRVRALVSEDLKGLTMTPDSRIAIYGATELTELVYLALRDMGVTRVDVFDREECGSWFLGMRVRSLDSMKPDEYVKVMVAYPQDLDERCQELQQSGVGPEQIVTFLQTSKLRQAQL